MSIPSGDTGPCILLISTITSNEHWYSQTDQYTLNGRCLGQSIWGIHCVHSNKHIKSRMVDSCSVLIGKTATRFIYKANLSTAKECNEM